MARSTLAAPAGARVRKRSLWAQIWRARSAYLFIAPFFILFTIFWIYPFLFAIKLSLHQYRGIGPMKYVGLGNYAELLFHDKVFWNSLRVSFLFFVILVPSLVAGSLVIASILNSARLRGRAAFRTAYFLPYVTSGVIVAIVFSSLFAYRYGWINHALQSIGLPRVPWIVTGWGGMISITILVYWKAIGYYTVVMLAGLQSISPEIYEAASIDGADTVQKFFRITVPMMRPFILFVVIMTTIGVLNLFDQPYVLTAGGPGYSTTTMTLWLYKLAFMFGRYGAASALGFITSTIIVTISILNYKFIGIREVGE